MINFGWAELVIDKQYKSNNLISSISGVFLIPYSIIMAFIGGPMLYMELSVGQFTGRGPIGALGHLCPLLKGNLYKQFQ